MRLMTSMIAMLVSTSALAAPSAPKAPKYEPGTYQVDAAHSKVGFEVSHLVISSVEGRFNKFEGTVDLAEKFDQSKVKMSVDTASINTEEAKRDAHLKSPEFFDVAKFGKMTFESASISGKPGKFKMNGKLTIRDKSKDVSFDSKYTGTVVDAWGNQKVAFEATTKISRKEFGLTWNNLVEAGPVVGDEVTLKLKIQAARPLPKVQNASAEQTSDKK